MEVSEDRQKRSFSKCTQRGKKKWNIRKSSKEVILKMRTEGKQRMEVLEEDRQKRSFFKMRTEGKQRMEVSEDRQKRSF